MVQILSPAILFDALAEGYEEMREEISWSPFTHIEFAFNTWDLATKRFLDLGCGTGEFSRWLQERGGECIGVDVSTEMCFIAASKSENLAFLPHDISQKLPFDDGSFDGVVALGCLEYIEDLKPVVADIARVLRAGGRLLAVFERRGADCPGGSEKSVLFYDHWLRFRQTREELQDLLHPNFSAFQMDQVQGYYLEETQERVQYFRVIADK